MKKKYNFKKRVSNFKLFMMIVLILLIVNTIIYAGVYVYDETTNSWNLLSDNDDSAFCITTQPEEYSGNIINSDISLTVTAHIGVVNAENPGKFNITVNPITDNIEVIEEDGEEIFQVDKEEYAVWEFIYRVENISEDENMNGIVVNDSFGAELDIKSSDHIYAPGVNPGKLDINFQGTMNKYSFTWYDFVLKPGEWAELIFEVETGLNPAGKQEYTACGLYDLNSGGILRYITDNNPGYSERKGYVFKVDVPCTPYVCIDLSATEIKWYLRKPGDYYTRALEGHVASNYPVVITFADFEFLKSAETTDTIPVFYQFNSEHPENWINAFDLNDTQIMLPTSNELIDWNLWQRLNLDRQDVGSYFNKGVITFTINNQ